MLGIKLEKRNQLLVDGRLHGSPKPSQGMLSSLGWLLGTDSTYDRIASWGITCDPLCLLCRGISESRVFTFFLSAPFVKDFGGKSGTGVIKIGLMKTGKISPIVRQQIGKVKA